MTFRLGLTGSIGMGKSTTAQLFAKLGCAVWDADDAVARLYRKGGAAVAPISAILPDAIVDGSVSKDSLRAILRARPEVLRQIEGIVHPLVREDRALFGATVTEDIAVFDIPLLFETGAEVEMDATVCVTVTPEIQQKRVLERGTMSLEDYELSLSKQMPNAEKCARATFVVETDTLENAAQQVQSIVEQIRQEAKDA